jgi:hypothetical protein
MFTPQKSRKVKIFSFSPQSEKQQAIYLIHDAPLGLLPIEKIDFQNQTLTYPELVERVKPIQELIDSLGDRLYSIHRYIGLVSVKKKEERTALDRFKEHASSCNSKPMIEQKRLCLALGDAAAQDRHYRMTALAYNINRSQIFEFEAHFIRMFEGLKDLGLNSNPGDVTRYRKFRIPLTGPAEDQDQSRSVRRVLEF